MLTTFWLSVQDLFPPEVLGPAGTLGELTRSELEDISQPLTVMLASSDETEALVPESVTIPANETTVTFPIDLVDDTLLDGEQLVIITGTAGPDWNDAWMFVQDYETADIFLDQTELSPGSVLTGTVTVSVAGHTEPVSVPLISSRPDEIASIVVEVPVGQQSVNFAIPVTTNGIAEGPHTVKINVDYDSGFYGNQQYVSVSDPGVYTLQPVADGQARDVDKDGIIFEQVATHFHEIITQAAAPNGSYGESRGIIEFDTSTIPAGAILQSAVLTLDFAGASYFPGNDLVFDVFAFQGNGIVDSADANQTGNSVGQLVLPTSANGGANLGSKPILLDLADIQSLVESGGHLGIVTTMPASTLLYRSKESFRQSSWPSLHLVWSAASGPLLTTNSLTIQEGGTVVLTAADLAATDSDSDQAALVFTVTNVTRGQFLVGGSPESSFTQADIAAGLVSFVHDGSELAPYYEVTVSDGTLGFGPQAVTVDFSNVNDQAPVIVPSQIFEVNENAATSTIVGIVAVVDADLPGDDFTFEILAGNDDGVFAIDSNGNLTIDNDTLLDFETTGQYVLTIGASDGVHFTNETVTVNVLDGEDIVPILTIDDTNLYETYGALATYGHVSRAGGDLSQPLTVNLSSSHASKLTVPASVIIPAFETEAIFGVGVIDDTLLGTEVVTVTASAVGGDANSVDVTVNDVETVTIQLDDRTASPGDTLVATISVSTTDRVEPLTGWLTSTRPDEIAMTAFVIDPSEQSVVVPITVTADEFPEGLHLVIVSVGAEGYNTYENPLGGSGFQSVRVELSDPGVTTISPAADGYATDADLDGNVFEQLNTNSAAILAHAASLSGSFGESRGILEFDVSTIPAGAIVESAVLTIDVTWAGNYPEVNDVVMDVFAYQGNGVVESSDANQLTNHVGQLFVDTDGSPISASYPIVLDIADVQSLFASGGDLGFVAKVQDSLLQFFSKEYYSLSSEPALHLVLAHPPVLTANALTLSEGETISLTAGNLAATDADSGDNSLTLTASNVSGGQFLVAGSPATAFTQAQLAAGQVAFAHDGGETAPSYTMSVSDGTYSDGPQAASINFGHVNDNAPVIPAGQLFSVSEHAADGAMVGTVTFGDIDLPGDNLTVSLVSGNNGGVFSVDNAGLLTVADNTNLDYESMPTYALTIRVDDGVHTTDQVVTVNVLDVPETKFYVVDDASANRTYEYTAAGTTIENYSLTTANTAPRGAASTAAGDRVWVVDNNRKVYVYNTSGQLLGSWSAGSLSSTATPHGIATDGTDVWIVDDKSNKVFKYAGAASRLSGSQSAASSFNLNSGNSTPRDIVTDGASLWVVNDASTNKVYKYTAAGSLLGSWTIDSANSSPTGITIDPASVNDIWIVDNGTDRVYQYTGAAARTSGSQSAAASFALAAGNGNPQGIADPPPREMLQNVAHSSAATRPAISMVNSTFPSTPVRKRSVHAAREQVFVSYRSAIRDVQAQRTKTSAAPSESDAWRDARSDSNDQLALERAFESVFSGAEGSLIHW